MKPNQRFMSRYTQSVYDDTIESITNIFAMVTMIYIANNERLVCI